MTVYYQQICGVLDKYLEKNWRGVMGWQAAGVSDRDLWSRDHRRVGLGCYIPLSKRRGSAPPRTWFQEDPKEHSNPQLSRQRTARILPIPVSSALVVKEIPYTCVWHTYLKYTRDIILVHICDSHTYDIHACNIQAYGIHMCNVHAYCIHVCLCVYVIYILICTNVTHILFMYAMCILAYPQLSSQW